MTGRARRLEAEVVQAAASDATAREILAACIDQPRSVKQISEVTGTPIATAYRHVNQLTEDGLLILDRSAISNDGKRYDLYRARVRAIRLTVANDGVTVTWEVDETVEDRLARLWNQMRL